MGRFIYHVELTSGKVSRSLKGDVDDEMVRTYRELLEDAISGGEPLLPMVDPPVTMTATGGGQCLSVTIWSADESYGHLPILAIGLANHSRCGASLWRRLHLEAHPQIEPATKDEPRPPEPWCAVRIDKGATLYLRESKVWKAIQELERAIAWAFLERAGDAV